MVGKSLARQVAEEEIREAVSVSLAIAGSKYCKALDRRANGLALLGYTNEDIADHFGVDRDTVARWTVEYPSFRRAIDTARVDANVRVVKAQYRAAVGFRARETKVFNVDGDLKTIDVTKVYPPNVQAATLVLTNRAARHWKDRKVVDSGAAIDLAELVKEAISRANGDQAKVIEGAAERVKDDPDTP